MTGKQTPPADAAPSSPSRIHTRTTRTHTSHPPTLADILAADETRRSGRANKGQHTKHPDLLDEPPVPKTKAQQKADKKAQAKGKAEPAREQSTQSAEQEDEEDDAIIRCVCGDQRDIRGRQMICCDRCEAWQHNKCLGLPEGDYWEDKTYFCEQCKPEDHQELLAAMARGEKPWARKKGSKPKPRPSDVKPEEKSRTPQQPATSTPSQPEAQPAQAPTPPPAPLAVQTSDASNGHAEKVCILPSRNTSLHLTHLQEPKSQPQSPLGEKRRHEAPAEKANASKKRRKSSQQKQETAAPPTPSVPDIDTLAQAQKPFAEKLRDVLTPLINTASDARGYRIPDGETAKSLASRLAVQVTLAAANHFGEAAAGSSPFATRLRTIMFNVKKNDILVDRVLSGGLEPQELATMPTEEMASEDKQREFAAMREAAEKQMILTEEPGPRLRKTHKGEELVGEEDSGGSDFKQPNRRESVVDDAPMQSPVGQRPPESPADAALPLSLDTTGTPTDSVRRPSTNFDISSVFDKVRSPQHDQQQFLQRRQSSMQMQEKAQAPVDDADVDRLLKDEDNDVEMSGYSSDPTVCWQGSISMQSKQSFDAVARFVAGGDFGQLVPWTKLLSNVLTIGGRIELSKGDDYIRGIGAGHSEAYDVAVLALNPVTTEDRDIFDHFYTYFQSRGRWGVVPVETDENDIMRDLYIIPIEAGGSNLPPFIDMLEYCTIETPRKEHMMLLALIAKLPEVKPHLPPTEHFNPFPAQQLAAGQVAQPQPANGPNPSTFPTNPHAPQYSPMAASFPPQGQYGNPFAQQQPTPPSNIPAHHQVPKALEIMGPYIDAPVIQTVLTQNLSTNLAISELQMQNLRHICDEHPEARTDFHAFTALLQKNQGGGSGSGGQTAAA